MTPTSTPTGARDHAPDEIVVGSHRLRIARKRTVRTPLWGYPTPAIIALVDLVDDQENEYPGVVVVSYRDGTTIVQRDIQSPHRDLPHDLSEVDWPLGVVVCEDGLPRYLPGVMEVA
jgi:hypothetical protein